MFETARREASLSMATRTDLSAHRTFATNPPGVVGERGESLGRRTDWSPLATTVTFVLAGYLAIAAALTGLGLVVVHVVVASRVGGWDEGATRWLAAHRTPWFEHVSSFLSKSADTLGVIVIAVVIVAVLSLRRLWWQVAVLVVGLALELAVFLTVNTLVDRPRPNVHKLGSTPSTSSFPSGHTAATVVVYASIAVFTWLATSRRGLRVLTIVLAILMPVAVAFSRVYEGMHHPIDVAFGMLMGVAVVAATITAISAGYGAEHAPVDVGAR
jgi:membrane-associated phospholipid phosphatase